MIPAIREKILVITCVLGVLIPVSPLNMSFAFRDSGVFLYFGWRILNGEIPYRDIWDHKPPIIDYINALGVALSSNSTWGVWLIQLLALLCSAYVGFVLLRKWFGSFGASVTLVLWMFAMIQVIDGGNLTTLYTFPMQIGCLWLAQTLTESNNPKKNRLFYIGFLSGMIFLTRQNAIGIPVAIAVFLVYSRLKNRQFVHLLQQLAPLLLGSVIPILFFTGYFAFHNSLWHFWDAAFRYNFFYIVPAENIPDNSLIPVMLKIWLFPLALVGLFIGLRFLLDGKLPSNWGPLFLIVMIDFPLEIFLYNLSGRGYLHYLMSIMPGLIFFVGIAVWHVQKELVKILPKAIKVTLGPHPLSLLLFASVVGYVLIVSVLNYASQVLYFRQSQNKTLAAYIQSISTPDDYVLFWGA